MTHRLELQSYNDLQKVEMENMSSVTVHSAHYAVGTTWGPKISKYSKSNASFFGHCQTRKL